MILGRLLGTWLALFTLKRSAASERRVAMEPNVSLWALPRHLTADTYGLEQAASERHGSCLMQRTRWAPRTQRRTFGKCQKGFST